SRSSAEARPVTCSRVSPARYSRQSKVSSQVRRSVADLPPGARENPLPAGTVIPAGRGAPAGRGSAVTTPAAPLLAVVLAAGRVPPGDGFLRGAWLAGTAAMSGR